MNSNLNKRSGILLHPTALPSDYGIGEIGPAAYQFIDNLVDMGQSLWQILPISPTDNYNSPYSSISTFAGNELLISLDLLVDDGLLDPSLLIDNKNNHHNKILFNDVINFKTSILKRVSKEFNGNASLIMKSRFQEFCKNSSYWLDDYSNYYALKIENKYASWIDWKFDTIKDSQIIFQSKVIQFIFHDQWDRLYKYCKDKGVQIIGDMPIYVGYDSADVYSHRDLFKLDSYGKMTHQGGCPPCKYQESGQLWGSPLYDWEQHEKNNFEWWNKRFKKLFQMVDIIRLDHFIGYIKYYSIPINDNTAHNGEWHKAPGYKLFDNLKSSLSDFNVIAEDLGDVTNDVINLRDEFQFPGMSILQFEFEHILKGKEFLENSIFCTGTHDNDTLLGWIESLSTNDINRLLQLLNCSIENIHWELINYVLKSSSNIAMIPIQDILGEKSSARFNTPGTLSESNWSWKMKKNDLTESIKSKLLELTIRNQRNRHIINNLN